MSASKETFPPKISASILSADFSRLKDEVQAVEEAGADYLHVDVMDGHFVPNLTIGPLVVKALRRVTALPLDVHLMISNPDFFLPEFIDAGANMVTAHVEATPHIHRTLMEIRRQGVRAGASIDPGTPLCALEPILESIDLALIMSVNPGFGGQAFIPYALRKIEELRQRIDQNKLKVDIFVDGGIHLENIDQVVRAGADVIVSGSAIFKTPSYKKTIEAMRTKMQESFSRG
jgi:ribulose-phosphate 3-epimerase